MHEQSRYDWKRILVPSGDQFAPPALRLHGVIRRAFPPVLATMNNACLFFGAAESLSRVKTICLPSGDQAGS